MTPPPSPLLRAPPFPQATAAVASVGGAPANAAAPTDAQVEAVFAALRDARVGGAFWEAPARTALAAIVRPRRGDDLARLARVADAPALWIGGRAPPEAKRLGAERTGAAVDPWSLLAPGRRLVAHGDDEWVAVATIAGADVDLLSPGRFGDPGDDPATRRRRIAAPLLAGAWRDPFTGGAASLDATVALLALWRAQIDANRPIVAAAGMAWWKRAAIRRFLWAPRGAPLRFLPGTLAVRLAARRGGSIAAWPSRVSAATLAAARRRGVTVVQVEDGFVRSAGLGVHLVPPQSVAVDALGIHYDPSGSSGLEALLAHGDFAPALRDRARALRETIVARGIGKYGSGSPDASLPPRISGRRLVLVPGQVEDDRSVLLGGGEVAGNLDLLRRVRAAEPDAEIWFRPHPDVDAGHRRGAVRDADALAHADRVVRTGGMAALLSAVDAVHVLTSLTGFEALLRGLAVTCHGTPFFAGWGLTRDLAPVPGRRGRRLDLDELVAATLIGYPRYLDPVTRLACPVEVLVARMAERPVTRPGPVGRLRRAQGWLLKR